MSFETTLIIRFPWDGQRNTMYVIWNNSLSASHGVGRERKGPKKVFSFNHWTLITLGNIGSHVNNTHQAVPAHSEQHHCSEYLSAPKTALQGCVCAWGGGQREQGQTNSIGSRKDPNRWLTGDKTSRPEPSSKQKVKMLLEDILCEKGSSGSFDFVGLIKLCFVCWICYVFFWRLSFFCVFFFSNGMANWTCEFFF